MKIIVDLCHPAHIHFFKYLIGKLREEGHQVLITTRDKEMLIPLLKSYHLDFIQLAEPGKSQIGLGIEMLTRDLRLYTLCRKFKPDIMIGLSENIAHIGKLLNIPSITFTDTEHATLSHLLMTPFSDVVCTPSCFRKNFGDHQIRYNGYHEIAYFHPDWFTPNPSVVEEAGLAPGEPYIIIRFVSWKANHDVGQHGIRDKVGLVEALEPFGRILITSEVELPPELEQYRIRIPPEKVHDLLYYATLYIGEGATMASEAALCGTPSIYISSLTGTMGNFIELEQTYDLLYCFSDSEKAVKKAEEILMDGESKTKWMVKRERLFHEKIDVTSFMVWLVTSYPESVQKIKENPEIALKTGDTF